MERKDAGGCFQCIVCLEDLPRAQRAPLACCQKKQGEHCATPAALAQVCWECLAVICAHGVEGVGRCPACKGFIRVAVCRKDDGSEENKVVVVDGIGICRCCNQQRTLVGEGSRLCDACVIGQHFCLRYECERCHTLSRIPHPMWRYQPSPASFGTQTWFCRVCEDFTHRRVFPDDIGSIPLQDAPAAWGVQDEWFAAIRRERGLAVRHWSSEKKRRGVELVKVVVVCFVVWLLLREFVLIFYNPEQP